MIYRLSRLLATFNSSKNVCIYLFPSFLYIGSLGDDAFANDFDANMKEELLKEAKSKARMFFLFFLRYFFLIYFFLAGSSRVEGKRYMVDIQQRIFNADFHQDERVVMGSYPALVTDSAGKERVVSEKITKLIRSVEVFLDYQVIQVFFIFIVFISYYCLDRRRLL